MTFREVVKTLQYIRDVLREYVATEERKRAEARARAEEAARRRAEEAAAREAELKAIQERLLAQQQERQEKADGRRRVRRGEGPRTSTPLGTRAPLSSAADPFASVATEWSNVAENQPAPTGRLAVLMQLSRLHAAILNLINATESSRAWFKKLQEDPSSAIAIRTGFGGLMMAVVKVLQLRYRDAQELAYRRRQLEFVQRLDRMLEGDWREKVRYILWTNGQRQARQAAMAA
jgi:hypothetical protein